MSAKQVKTIVMFADISGSSALFERLGNKEAMHTVERCLKRMSRSIEGYRGKTLQIIGDELLARFDSAEDACQAAIDMQQRIADLPPVSGHKLNIRIGIHAGTVNEVEGKISGEVVTNTARIAGISRSTQILGSSTLVEELAKHNIHTAKLAPELGSITENGARIQLYYIEWPAHGIFPESLGPKSILLAGTRLCLRYRGKTHILDESNPVLTLGRDLNNNLIIEDRKASRQHARIEKRENGCYLIDSSSNGSFVSINGRQEIMLRKHELQLEGSGRICFGSSGNDPAADGAEFEFM